jgi:hypothetical protein
LNVARFVEEYVKHSALNVGQLMHGLRYLHSHPDFDEVAERGSVRHLTLSLSLRMRRAGNDLWFALIPPHWHHSTEELRTLSGVSVVRWFGYGYSAWRFADDGSAIPDAHDTEDGRWDPRCLRARQSKST